MTNGTDRTGLAEERTDLAQDRTLLANERTFAGWIRTGLAAVGVGLGFHALFRSMDPIWPAKAIATLFVLVGIFIVWAAERRACKVERRIDAYQVSAFGARNLRVVAIGMATASLALIGALWLLV